MTIATSLHLSGQFNIEAFRRYAENRARLLSIRAEATRFDCREIVFSLEGLRELIDMFIMACLIGPADCSITEWREGAQP